MGGYSTVYNHQCKTKICVNLLLKFYRHLIFQVSDTVLIIPLDLAHIAAPEHARTEDLSRCGANLAEMELGLQGRATEGVERGGEWEGCPLPIRLGVWGAS